MLSAWRWKPPELPPAKSPELSQAAETPGLRSFGDVAGSKLGAGEGEGESSRRAESRKAESCVSALRVERKANRVV